MFCNPFVSLQQLAHVVCTVTFTRERDTLGVPVTVCRMWLKTLMRVLMFFPHSVPMALVLWGVALATTGHIWPRLPALPLPLQAV